MMFALIKDSTNLDMYRDIPEVFGATKEEVEVYKGDWDDAKPYMRDCGLELAGVFIERMNHTKPRDWSGIWTMTSK